MRRFLVVPLALAALVVAGCGDSDTASGPGADPAKVVPADAPVYIEAVVRPDGDVGDGVRDALKKLLQTDDPDAKVIGLVNKLLAEGGYEWDDVKAWLGKRVGGFLTGIEDGKPAGAIVVAVTDQDKASDMLLGALEKEHEGKLTKQDYKGVQLTGDDEAAIAFLDDYAVVGTIDGVKQVVDTSLGGRPLSDVADYNAVRTAVKADDGLGVAYVEPRALLDIAADAMTEISATGAPVDSDAIDLMRQLFAKIGRAAGLSLHATGDAVRIDAAALGAPAGAHGTAAADTVAALPSDAWLAVGVADLGGTLKNVIAQIGQLAKLGNAAAPDLGQVFGQVEDATGLDVERDFLSWMGDAALYARGRSLADIGAVLTVKSKDPERSRKAVRLLADLLKGGSGTAQEATVEGYDTAMQIRDDGLPVSVFIAANDDRFSIGVNPKALTDVIAPAETLGDSETYANATKALGGDVRPVFLVDIPTVVGLLETFGLGENEGYKKVKPYLDALGPLSAGTARDGDVARFALALGLR